MAKRHPRLTLILLAAVTAILMIAPSAPAGGKSGVWPVTLAEDNTAMSGVDGGASIFVVDLTAKTRYTGNAVGQLTGITLSGVSNPHSAATEWPVDGSTGISIYYADFLFNPGTDSSASPYQLVNWTVISANTSLLGGSTVYSFDIPWNPATPYGAIKVVQSGASPIVYGLRVSTSGNP